MACYFIFEAHRLPTKGGDGEALFSVADTSPSHFDWPIFTNFRPPSSCRREIEGLKSELHSEKSQRAALQVRHWLAG